MTVIVTDDGFAQDDFGGTILPLADWRQAPQRAAGVDLAPDTPPAELAALVDRADLVRIAFPAFSDGRGFTLARLLRLAGYRGRLRAVGHVIADQYAMARRAGFDEVEIPEDLAARQPEAQWRARGDWRAHDYQSRLRG